jgi:hypothetical protein
MYKVNPVTIAYWDCVFYLQYIYSVVILPDFKYRGLYRIPDYI